MIASGRSLWPAPMGSVSVALAQYRVISRYATHCSTLFGSVYPRLYFHTSAIRYCTDTTSLMMCTGGAFFFSDEPSFVESLSSLRGTAMRKSISFRGPCSRFQTYTSRPLTKSPQRSCSVRSSSAPSITS